MLPNAVANEEVEDDLDLLEDEDEFEDDEFIDEDFLGGEEEWEDLPGMEAILAAKCIPTNWHVVKVINFWTKDMKEMDEWLKENCSSPYERFGWRSSCSTKVGVAFSNITDAVLFKLRWR